jgi:hypothetical protein
MLAVAETFELIFLIGQANLEYRNASVVLTGLRASAYYAFTIVWPSMVAVLYSDGGVLESAGLSTFIGLFIIIGQIVGGKCAIGPLLDLTVSGLPFSFPS